MVSFPSEKKKEKKKKMGFLLSHPTSDCLPGTYPEIGIAHVPRISGIFVTAATTYPYILFLFLHFLKKILFFCATISLSILDFNNWPQIFTYWVETYPLSLSRNLPCDPYYCHSRNLDSTAYQCALHMNHHVAQNIMRVTIMNLHFFEVESIAIWEYMG